MIPCFTSHYLTHITQIMQKIEIIFHTLQICYFFYKNIAFAFTIFFFEIYSSFSGQSVYNDWYLSLYNVFFTSLPVMALGVFDQDVSARLCLKVYHMLVSFIS